ncbi:MAG: hypothetical protein ACI8ZN_000054 [Bacteroidia bacterium]|jgi:hypothetical protein
MFAALLRLKDERGFGIVFEIISVNYNNENI